jgi:hypothetical protein
MDAERIFEIIQAATDLEFVLQKLDEVDNRSMTFGVIEHAVMYPLARDAARELATSRAAAAAIVAVLENTIVGRPGKPGPGYVFLSSLLAELRQKLE